MLIQATPPVNLIIDTAIENPDAKENRNAKKPIC
jgi:hypothetical protein